MGFWLGAVCRKTPERPKEKSCLWKKSNYFQIKRENFNQQKNEKKVGWEVNFLPGFRYVMHQRQQVYNVADVAFRHAWEPHEMGRQSITS